MTRSAKRRLKAHRSPFMTGQGLPNFNVCHPVVKPASHHCQHHDFDVEVDEELGREPTLFCTRCGKDLGLEAKYDVHAKLSAVELEIVSSWDPTRRSNPEDVRRYGRAA